MKYLPMRRATYGRYVRIVPTLGSMIKITYLSYNRVVLPGAGANRFRPTAGGVCP